MRDYWFFLSYATTDDTGHVFLKRFFHDLAVEVRMKAGLNAELKDDEIGFFAGESIKIGAEWPPFLVEGLQSSRVIVCLLSPGYIASEYCGKEFTIFESRWRDHQMDSGVQPADASVILPVRWNPVEDKDLPSPLLHIQNKQGEHGDRYANNGLYGMLKCFRNEYKRFLLRFAETLVKVAKMHHPLKRLTGLPRIKDVPSAFHRVENTTTHLSAGPGVAQFVFVAGRPFDFKRAKVREKVDCYSEDGGRYWRPFLPTVLDNVGYLAQSVAIREKFQSDVIPLDAKLVQLLRKAERDNKIIIVLVDSWTIRLDKYKKIMCELDACDVQRVVILILSNNQDPETLDNLGLLRREVFAVFQKRPSKPDYFREPVESKQAFLDELGRAMQRVLLQIIQSKDVVRKLDTSAFIEKPVIHGPGGKV
jgi:FxsC-like protein